MTFSLVKQRLRQSENVCGNLRVLEVNSIRIPDSNSFEYIKALCFNEFPIAGKFNLVLGWFIKLACFTAIRYEIIRF